MPLKNAKNLTPGRPAKPPGLNKRESAECDRIVSELDESGVPMTKAHRALVENAATIAECTLDG